MNSTFKPSGSNRSSNSSTSGCANSRAPKIRMLFTASRNSAGNWPSVMRVSRATTSACSVRRPASSSTVPSSDRKATTPPPAVTCNATFFSPITSASTPDFSAAGNCSAEMAGVKLTGFSFAAIKTFSSAARCVLGIPASMTFCLPSANGLRESQTSNVATSE